MIVIVVPRNLKFSTVVKVLFMMVSGGSAGGFLLKFTIIFTVLSVFSSRLLRLHQTASSKVYIPLSLNTVLLWMISDVFGFVTVVHEPFQVLLNLWFSRIFFVFELFPAVTVSGLHDNGKN